MCKRLKFLLHLNGLFRAEFDFMDILNSEDQVMLEKYEAVTLALKELGDELRLRAARKLVNGRE